MAKKPAKKTTPTKATPKKTVTKKATAKKTVTKKTTKKTATKKVILKPASRKPASKATASKDPVVKKTVRKKPVSRNAQRKTPASPPRQPITRIVVRKDVGFGNEMFIRGKGGELSWDSGVHMQCTGEGEWTFETPHATEELVVKFLINDDEWSEGENLVAQAGEALVVEPSF